MDLPREPDSLPLDSCQAAAQRADGMPGLVEANLSRSLGQALASDLAEGKAEHPVQV
jgi:hypothetical protein